MSNVVQMLKELVTDNPRQSFTDSDISPLTERSYSSLKVGTKRSVVNFPRRRHAGSNAILISYKNSPLRAPYLATRGRRSPNASIPTFDELSSSETAAVRAILEQICNHWSDPVDCARRLRTVSFGEHSPQGHSYFSSRFTNNAPPRNSSFFLVALVAVFSKGGKNFATGAYLSPSTNARIDFRVLVRVEKRRRKSITQRLWQQPVKVYFEISSTAVKTLDICVTNVSARIFRVKIEANFLNVFEYFSALFGRIDF